MYPAEKYPQNEKLKSLKEQTELISDAMMDPETNLRAVALQTLHIVCELIDTLMKPEAPG